VDTGSVARIRYEDLASTIRARLPACGPTTVAAIDGPSGAGKSVIADRLGSELDATVLEVDEFVPGWRGLAAMPPVLARDLLAPIAAGETAAIRRWDWVHDRPGEILHVPPMRYLVLDGCGSGSRITRPYLSLLVWVDAPVAVRRERALARDGDVFEPWWGVWAAQERTLFAVEGTALAADVHLRSA
jgi:para-aminobenzoate synthetase